MSEKPRIHISFMLGSHMDLYWMAPPRDCLDRGCDIINEALALCERYPDYCFYIESTVFTEYYMSCFPENKARLAALLEQNRLEIAACYVDRYEHMHGGESIVRHHIYGQRYLMETFGRKNRSTCHSDLPGLSPQIPQICALSDIEFYIRARGPAGVYDWRAPDGTGILYCSVGYSYGKINDERLAREINSAGAFLPHYVMRGGYGDLQMPDDAIRNDLVRFGQAYPDIEFAISSPSPVFDQYLKSPEQMAALPRISGEWPIGWASVVAGNIRSFQKNFRQENYLLSLEKLAGAGLMLGETVSVPDALADWWIALGRFKGDITPKLVPQGKELYETWKAELFTQDHNYSGFGGPKTALDRDIIKQHSHAFSRRIEESAMANLTKHIGALKEIGGCEVLRALMVFNPLAWQRDALCEVLLPEYAITYALVDAAGKPVAFAREGHRLRFAAKGLPGMGYRMYYLIKAEVEKPRKWFDAIRAGGQLQVETARYRAAFDAESGTVSSLFDKTLGKELVSNKVGRRFGQIISMAEQGSYVIYDFTGEETTDADGPCSVRIEAENEVFVSVLIETEIFGAKTQKRFIFYRELDEIGMELDMYWWGKKNECMKLCLPFTEERFSETRYGVPFYNMRWPEMMQGIDDDVVLGVGKINTDEIKPEYRRHMRDITKWVDIGYEGWGVTLATELPLIRIDGNTVEPFILRTGYSCGDPHAWVLNQGHQHWRYALRPHTGDAAQGGSYRYGWEQATPPLCALVTPKDGPLNAEEHSFCVVDAKNVIVSAAKPAYDANKLLIRLFETDGKAGTVRLALDRRPQSANLANLLETPGEPLAIDGNAVLVDVQPYQIVNILLTFDSSKGE